jgi:hypothetical protein
MNEIIGKWLSPIVFESPLRLGPINSWHGHMPFGFWLVEAMKPKTIVELGSHHGDSYCCFCQAVTQLKLSTKTYAVDTWAGDEHAGFYDDSVYQGLKTYHDPLYSSFSQLVRSTFDEALDHFGEGTVDLLHIDGLHTYEAVKHDFESWLPKMSSHGVIIFHDINVRHHGFGVWKLWDELKVKFPSVEFSISYGLGLIAVGKEASKRVLDLCALPEVQKEEFRRYFGRLGDAVLFQSAVKNNNATIAQQQKFLENKDEYNIKVSKMVEERDAVIKELHQQIKELHHQIEYLQQTGLLNFLRKAKRHLR